MSLDFLADGKILLSYGYKTGDKKTTAAYTEGGVAYRRIDDEYRYVKVAASTWEELHAALELARERVGT